jgi:hypothetical protein
MINNKQFISICYGKNTFNTPYNFKARFGIYSTIILNLIHTELIKKFDLIITIQPPLL